MMKFTKIHSSEVEVNTSTIDISLTDYVSFSSSDENDLLLDDILTYI